MHLHNDLDRLAAEVELITLSPAGEAALAPRLRADLLAAARRATGTSRALRVVVVGGFNRGKSSLINQLVGASLLPTSVLPETFCSMRLVHSRTAAVTARSRDGTCRSLPVGDSVALSRAVLADAVGEHNREIQEITIHHTADVLRRIEFADTPGLGDAFHRFDEAVGAAMLDADCVICVVSATEPLSLEELAMVDTLFGVVARPTTVIALTRADLLPDQQTVDQVSRNLAARLLSHLPHARIFPVCTAGVTPDDAASGIGPLRQFLERLAEGGDIVGRVRAGWHAAALVAKGIADLDRAGQLAANASGASARPASIEDPIDAHGRREQLAATLRECRQEAQQWMRAFAHRIGREVFTHLHRHEPADLQRRLHFFLVEAIGKATQACLAEHSPRIAAAAGAPPDLDRATNDGRMAMHAIGTGLGEWTSSDAAAFTGGVLCQLTTVVAPTWSRWVRTAWNCVQFALGIRRPAAANEVVRDEAADLASRMAELSEFLSDGIGDVYRGIESETLVALASSEREAAAAAAAAADRLRPPDTPVERPSALVRGLAERLAHVREELAQCTSRLEQELAALLHPEDETMASWGGSA